MKIKVISCEKPTWWYANELGKEFEVEQHPHDRDDFWCEDVGSSLSKVDCEVVRDTTVIGTQAAQSQVGNINSNEKGSGARYNSGKPDYSMLILKDLLNVLERTTAYGTNNDVLYIIKKLAVFQQTHNVEALYELLSGIPQEYIEEATHVFTYGAKKYAAWNWAKGFNWSVPLACAVRHSLAELNGELADVESGRRHMAHVVCNVFMLIHCTKHYKEGNDLPPRELFEDSCE
jgi:hypothetical protein